jgi:uncharacterized protein (DUF58 family)
VSVTTDDPELFLATSDLELVARAVVEGALAGLHRSPWIGSSVEFESHRDYQRGDDLRTVNWNLWGRHNRLFVKQYRADTNLNLYLLLDCSGSMATANGKASKWAYATRITAALAMLAYRSHDATSLLLMRDHIVDFVPPKTGLTHFHDVVTALDRANPEGVGNLSAALGQAPDFCRRRGVVIVVSDFFDDADDLISRVNDLRAWGHDVVVIQVMDEWEYELPETGHYRVRDLETGVEIRTDASTIREATTARVEAWCAGLREQCVQAGVDWLTVRTDQPLAETMAEYLIRRAEGG